MVGNPDSIEPSVLTALPQHIQHQHQEQYASLNVSVNFLQTISISLFNDHLPVTMSNYYVFEILFFFLSFSLWECFALFVLFLWRFRTCILFRIIFQGWKTGTLIIFIFYRQNSIKLFKFLNQIKAPICSRQRFPLLQR